MFLGLKVGLSVFSGLLDSSDLLDQNVSSKDKTGSFSLTRRGPRCAGSPHVGTVPSPFEAGSSHLLAVPSSADPYLASWLFPFYSHTAGLSRM